jgi:ubiquinone/menaquinone biosynthesis C-methylase UbiE
MTAPDSPKKAQRNATKDSSKGSSKNSSKDATKTDGPPTPPATATARALEKQERLARVYDAEVGPAFAQRFARMLLGALDARPAARVVEVGCATGALTLELSRRFDLASRVVALDEAPFVARARPKVEAASPGRVTFEVGPAAPLSLPDASADVVVSNLAAAAFADPARAVREMERVLAPGGQAIVTTPLRGSWVEFLDIYRDVLLDSGPPESVAALDQYVASIPDGPAAASWFEAAGLGQVEIAVERWEILFKSAREFFFAPLIELGPLSRWKRIAGRGEEMQDVFFFTKEAIDTYFHGAAFPITIVGAVIKGRKPAPAAR